MTFLRSVELPVLSERKPGFNSFLSGIRGKGKKGLLNILKKYSIYQINFILNRGAFCLKR